jgi:hypothetical protein
MDADQVVNKAARYAEELVALGREVNGNARFSVDVETPEGTWVVEFHAQMPEPAKRGNERG